jgi:hypothetical protein
MAVERRGYPFVCFANAWEPAFETRRDLKGNNQTYVEAKRSAGAIGDDLSVFLSVSEESGRPPFELEEVKRFCQGTRIEGLKPGTAREEQQRVAWLDDRNSPRLTGSGSARQYENPLTATELNRLLKKPV